MTMTDSVMFVKETKTCHYVLVVNTPRLCGEPGFKSRVDQRDEALIRCRQVVDAATLANADTSLPEADHPFHQRRGPVSGAPPLDAAETPAGVAAETDGDGASQRANEQQPGAKDSTSPVDHHGLLRRALEAILQKAATNPEANGAGAGAGAGAAPRVVVEDVGDGEMVIEFISEVEMDEDDGSDNGRRRAVDDISRLMDSKAFEDALREAGFDVRDEEVEVEVEMGSDAEREGKERQKKGERTPDGAAKGRKAAYAHPDRDEL
jgi:protein OS-9